LPAAYSLARMRTRARVLHTLLAASVSVPLPWRLVLALALPIIASVLMAAHGPLNQPPLNCPPGSYLSARSLVGGNFQSPIYHCFRDADERDDRWVEPRPT
jgi:hypothetical protein